MLPLTRPMCCTDSNHLCNIQNTRLVRWTCDLQKRVTSIAGVFIYWLWGWTMCPYLRCNRSTLSSILRCCPDGLSAEQCGDKTTLLECSQIILVLWWFQCSWYIVWWMLILDTLTPWSVQIISVWSWRAGCLSWSKRIPNPYYSV